jgi:hypothetical protein
LPKVVTTGIRERMVKPATELSVPVFLFLGSESGVNPILEKAA